MKKLPKKLYAYRDKWGVVAGTKEIVESGKTREVGVYELVWKVKLTSKVVEG